MNYQDLTAEQKERVKSCTSAEELLALAKEDGYELTEQELEAVAGGGEHSWDCFRFGCDEFLDFI